MKSRIFCKLPAFMGVLFFVFVLFCGCSRTDSYDYGEELPEADPEKNAALEEPAQYPETNEPQTPESSDVQVCGAVVHPGVYELKPGARIFEAVEKSGGLTPEAAAEAVNQAAEAVDGAMIRIPTTEEWQQTAGEQPQAADDGLVDINTADAAELMGLSGIGQSKAESIIEYREKNGAFSAIEDITKVSGIGDGLFQKIKDKIRV